MNNREKTQQIVAEQYAHFAELDIPVEEVKDLIIDRLANLLVLERDISAGERFERRQQW